MRETCRVEMGKKTWSVGNLPGEGSGGGLSGAEAEWSQGARGNGDCAGPCVTKGLYFQFYGCSERNPV